MRAGITGTGPPPRSCRPRSARSRWKSPAIAEASSSLRSPQARPPGRGVRRDHRVALGQGLTTGEIRAPGRDLRSRQSRPLDRIWDRRDPAIIRLWRSAWEQSRRSWRSGQKPGGHLHDPRDRVAERRFRQATTRCGHFPMSRPPSRSDRSPGHLPGRPVTSTAPLHDLALNSGVKDRRRRGFFRSMVSMEAYSKPLPKNLRLAYPQVRPLSKIT
jgi:hypothetical protein